MERRPIDIKLISAKDLKDVNTFSKMDVYVIASVSGDPRSIQRSPVDKDGGTSPKWNYEMQFIADEEAAQQNRIGLVFQIMSDRTLGDKEVGRVYIPLKELIDGYTGRDGEKVEREYQVQTPSGKFKGTLKFAYKFGDKFTQKQPIHDPVMAYPAAASGAGSSGAGAFPAYADNNKGAGAGAGAYPPASGMYAPPVAAPYPAPGGYPPAPQGYGPPPPQAYPYAQPGGYPPQGYAYGYGYPGAAPPQGYPQQGYVQQPQKPKKGSKFGLGAAAAGLGAGLLGGMLVGEMAEDVAEAAAYDDVFDY